MRVAVLDGRGDVGVGRSQRADADRRSVVVGVGDAHDDHRVGRQRRGRAAVARRHHQLVDRVRLEVDRAGHADGAGRRVDVERVREAAFRSIFDHVIPPN